MTKSEIKARLTANNVAFAPKANLDTLTGLWNAHLASMVIDPTAAAATKCPHCDIGLDNGLLHVDDCAANSDQSYREQRDPGFEQGQWMCMGCGGHFGEPVAYPATATGLKIEKDREERNGIKRPSIGGRCRAVWDALDAYVAETGEQPDAKVVKSLAADEGWNPNNASIEFYQWRKFNGITGRQPKVAAPATE